MNKPAVDAMKNTERMTLEHGFSSISLLIAVIGMALLVYVTVLYVTGTPELMHPSHMPESTQERQGITQALPENNPVNRHVQNPLAAPDQSPAVSRIPLLPRSSASVKASGQAAGQVVGQTSAQPLPVKQMHAIQSKLQHLLVEGHGQVDPAKLDPILAELAALPGQHGRIGGVDIGVLRRNLGRASEMQTIALKIQALAKKTDASNAQELKAAMTRLQALQGEMEAVTVISPIPQTDSLPSSGVRP